MEGSAKGDGLASSDDGASLRALLPPLSEGEAAGKALRQRRVFLRRGYAYVPKDDLVSIVANQVRMHLSKPKRSRGLERSGREERMERMRRKKLTDLEREEEDEAKKDAPRTLWE